MIDFLFNFAHMDNLDFNFFCKDCKQTREYRLENCFTQYRAKGYSKGEYIAFQGDRVKELRLVISGAVTVDFVLPSGIVLRTVQHEAPYPIGALALLGRENRYRVDVIAEQDCETIAVGRDAIERQIMNCREFMLSFFDYSTSKVDLFVEHLTVLSQRSIRAKLAFYIFMNSDADNKYEFGRSIKKLSAYLCVERPSLSRVIAQFVEQGLISYNGGKGEILNVDELKNILELA